MMDGWMGGLFAHASTVDTVIHSPELFNRGVNHALDAGCIRHIDQKGKNAVIGIGRELFAFFRRLPGPFLVDVREDDGDCSGFGEGKRGLPADTSGGLSRSSCSVWIALLQQTNPCSTYPSDHCHAI